MNLYVLSYTDDAASGRRLAEKIGAPFLYRVSDIRDTPDSPDTVIFNWGRGRGFDVGARTLLNNPEAVCRAVDKRTAFADFTRAGVPTPGWTTNRDVAVSWQLSGSTVYARTHPEGFDGAGLFVVHPIDTLPIAPLYTRAIPYIIDEYRVTVFKNKATFTQKKVPVSARDRSAINYSVRTTAGGWGFDPAPAIEELSMAAINAVYALGLDYGGVDLILAREHGARSGRSAYVLEVNTAPLLTPMCASAFTAAIKEYLENVSFNTGIEQESGFDIPPDEYSAYRDIIT